MRLSEILLCICAIGVLLATSKKKTSQNGCKLQFTGQIQLTANFYMAHKLRMVSVFCNG